MALRFKKSILIYKIIESAMYLFIYQLKLKMKYMLAKKNLFNIQTHM